MSDLNTLFPGQELTINGEVLTIQPFNFGQLPKALSLSRNIFSAVQDMFQGEVNEAKVILDIMALGGEDLLELIALGINKNRSYFNSIRSDDGIKIATAFLEINLSFFAQKLLPEFKMATEKLKATTVGLQQ